MDTIDRMVLAGPLAWQPPAPQRSRRWLPYSLAGAALAAILIAAFTLSIPYYALGPGSARQVNDLVSAPEGQSFIPKGKVLFTTVSLRKANPIDIAHSWIDEDIKIIKEEDILGTTPPKQYRRLNLQEMDESKRTAIVVALRRLGHQVPARGQGALITTVITGEGFPAEGKLDIGEVITAIDGQPVQFVEDAVNRLQEHKPGESVRVQLTDTKGASRIEQLVLARNPDGRAVLGVELQTYKLDYDLPFDVSIESGDIGGPSAGLAFTLGVLDDLTAGELTGGVNVAVTGTMGIDEKVGEVGGVVQKTAAVIDSGAKYFFVPPGEFEAAKKRAGKRLTVIKVTTLEDALAALAKLGGNVSALGPRPAGLSG